MAQHTMRKFDQELGKVREYVLLMGGMVEKAIRNAMQAMLEHDEDLAESVIQDDAVINALEVRCDELIRDILVRRQPVIRDFRAIMGASKVVTDLERMGDLTKGIAEQVLQNIHIFPRHYSNLEVMHERVLQQVGNALDAFSRNDVDLAMDVIKNDRRVDDLYKALYREALTYMMEDPRDISNSIMISATAKNLERIADHATNVAEMVIYIIRAHDIRHVNHDAVARMLADDEP
ncbi:MAG: phosphate signaling complex protein PhoU [Mariprofundaceae bacterium]|nr:phosphate signaling complex protein PhoU [Mariprofundaceae bacterium]